MQEYVVCHLHVDIDARDFVEVARAEQEGQQLFANRRTAERVRFELPLVLDHQRTGVGDPHIASDLGVIGYASEVRRIVLVIESQVGKEDLAAYRHCVLPNSPITTSHQFSVYLTKYPHFDFKTMLAMIASVTSIGCYVPQLIQAFVRGLYFIDCPHFMQNT